MFKLTKETRYKWPVTVHVPKDGGAYGKHTFTAEFIALPRTKVDALIIEDANGDFLHGVLVGWSGVQDEEGSEKQFSDEARNEVLDIPYVRSAVLRAYFESVAGDGARRKN